jgi:ceramide glucosyltransferase
MRFFMSLPDIALAGLATLGAIYHGVTTILLRRRFAAPAAVAGVDAPGCNVTFLRPVKPGVARLREKIGMLAAAADAGDQIIVGVENDDDARECAGFPNVEVVRCEPGRALNPKINKLLQMTPRARHTHWIVTDSEALPDAAFFRCVRAEWAGADCVTAGYRFTGATTLPQRLDCASALLTLWPGLMLARMEFVLGACFAVKREDVEAAGGWEAFADFLHEDNRLGAALAKAGKRIVLSRAVLSLEADEVTWRNWWRHQLRVALTYRVSSPAGWLGMPLTYSTAWALAFALCAPCDVRRWLLPCAVLALRWLSARMNAAALGFSTKNLAAAVLVQSVCEPLWWLAGWGLRSVTWGARVLRVTRDGRIRDPR